MIRKMSFAEAINLAMAREMEGDPNVCAFGVDVKDHKRTFNSGKDLVEKFGSRRYFGSPLSEAAATGIAIGAALSGLRPVHIHARADFMLLAMNQLVNMASNKRWLLAGRLKVPMVVRAIIGRSWGQGAQHSKTMHSTLAHFPGLKVALPASCQDGYSLLRSAIRDDDPVIFLEHRWLYFLNEEVDDELAVPLGQSKVVRSGTDVTIVACSWMVVEAMQAAAILFRNGVEAEVVDVRTVTPLDDPTIMTSVRKTGRVIIADYDWTFVGFSAELSARITESCFSYLKSAPVRIGLAPTPCPTTRSLEDEFYPSACDIVRAAEKILGLVEVNLAGEDFYTYQKLFKGPF